MSDSGSSSSSSRGSGNKHRRVINPSIGGKVFPRSGNPSHLHSPESRRKESGPASVQPGINLKISRDANRT